MSTVSLRITGWSSFEADWAEAQAALGTDVWLRDEDGNKYLPRKGPVFSDNLRFDFDLIDPLVTRPAKLDSDGNVTQPAVTKGPHVNIQVSLAPNGDPGAGDQLQQDLIAYIRTFPWQNISAPDDLDPTDAYEHTLTHGSRVIVREIMDEQGNITGYTATPKIAKRVFG